MEHRWVIVLTAFGLLLAGCGAGEGITVDDAWVRPAPMPGGNGAGYMVIRNNGDDDDALVRADADFAEAVELHESMIMESDEGGEMAMMEPVSSIAVPAGDRAALEPGGYHVMLIGVEDSLEPGQMVTLSLTFENAGVVVVEAEVRDE
jgi:copper(I)-binding protein